MQVAREIKEQIGTAQKQNWPSPHPANGGTARSSVTTRQKLSKHRSRTCRIKPEYTTEAGLYDVAATVEIVIDADASGEDNANRDHTVGRLWSSTNRSTKRCVR